MKGARIVVAGAGIQMRRHLLPALLRAGCTITGVIDPDMDSATELAESLGALAASKFGYSVMHITLRKAGPACHFDETRRERKGLSAPVGP